MKKITSLLIAVFLIAFSGCKKGDSGSSPADDNSKTELLTSKPWKNYSVKVKQNDGTWQDSPIPDCQKDDLKFFESDGSVYRDKGAQRCPTETDSDKAKEATWKWNSDQSVLITDSPQVGIIQNKVEKLDKDVMILYYPGTGGTSTSEILQEFRH
ncbi:MAG TPA: hypothetical protein VF421_05325 [Niabella sp.]